MTVEVSGIASAQARIQEIQQRFGPTQNSTSAQSTSSSATGDAGASSFDARLAKATAIARANAAPATAASPFVWDPTLAPGNPTLKPGGAQALQGPAGTGDGTGSSSVGSSSTVGGTSGTGSTSGVSGTGEVSPVDGVAGTSRVDKLIASAKKYLGVPYKWGGTNPAKGLDCSGFTQLVYRENGVSIPRVARDQQRAGTSVPSLAQAKPGDLLFYGNPAHHVTMYLGDGKMIHAPRTGDVVKIVSVYGKPSSIRRFLPEGSDQPSVTRGGNADRSGSLPTTAIDGSAIRNAALAQATAAAIRGMSTSGTSAASDSLGGWAGATPAPNTWGAAVAAAAASPIDSIIAGTPTGSSTTATAPVLPSTAATTAATAADSVAGPSAGGGVLAQAPESLRPLFAAAARKHGVSADLLAAVAKQESNFKTRAVSHAGARGLMQLMPGTARGLGVRDSFDPAQAIDGAARLLRDHLRTFGSTKLALAAYNAGPGAVRRYHGVPPYAETQNYVRRIMSNLSRSAA